MSSEPGHKLLALLATLVAVGLATWSFAQEPVDEQSGTQALRVAQDMVFASGEDLRLNARSSDDVFAAGNTVVVDGVRADHLHVAASELSIAGIEANDLIAAAGEIELETGTIADDIVAAAGEISIGPDFNVGGSAVLGGGTVTIDAPIPGDLRVGGGEVILNSAVNGTARFTADTVVIGPDARIAGDLEYRSENLVMRPGAVVEGETRILPVSEPSNVVRVGNAARAIFLMIGFSILLSYFLLVLVLAFAVPGLMRSASQGMRERPWKSLGVGLLVAVVVPVLVGLLIWSIAAVPMAVLLVVMSIAATPIALAATAYFTGERVRLLIARKDDQPIGIGARLLWPGLGAVLIFALTLIPIAGPAIWLFAMLFGLGAIVTSAGKAFAVPSQDPV